MTLNEEIAHYTGRGFRVNDRGEDYASLTKPKKFNLLAFFMLLGVFYLPFYVAKRDEHIYLYIKDGTVHRKGGRWTLGGWAMRKAQGRA